MRWFSTLRMRWSRYGRELSQGAPVTVWDLRKPCRGRNSNVCVAEGCYGEACLSGISDPRAVS